MVEGTESHLDTKEDSINIQDLQQRSRKLRKSQNRKKNTWRPVSGVSAVLSKSQLNIPVAGDRDESLRKLNGSDGEEEIVWSGREKLPEISQGSDTQNLALPENLRGTISKNTSPRGVSRRAPVSCKGPASIPVSNSSSMMPLATSLSAENREGIEDGNMFLQSKGCKETQAFHQHSSLHHDLRTRSRNEENGFGERSPQSQIPHFASSSEFTGLLSVLYSPDHETAPRLMDPIFVRPPRHDHGGYCREQHAPSIDLLGVHPAGLGKGRGNRNNKREESVMGTIVGNGSKQGGGVHSKDCNTPQDRSQRRRNRKPSQETSNDIFVSQPFSPNHDRPQTIKVGSTKVASMAVVNIGTEKVKLSAVKLLHSSPRNSFGLSLSPLLRASSSTKKNVPLNDSTKLVFKSKNLVPPVRPWIIEPELHITFEVACTGLTLGLHKAILLLIVGSQKIIRYITLLCEDDIAEALAPIEPYARLPRPRVQSFCKFFPGIPPPLPLFKKRLGVYPIPKIIKKTILMIETPPVLMEGLLKKNYSEYFSTLMFAEELQMEVDIRDNDMYNVTMWKVSHTLLGLRVPGLAERRPSVIYRDKIYARPSGTTATEFQGYVHEVHANEVHLRFSDAFHKGFISNSRFDIRFSFSRVNIRRAHQGIQAAKALVDSLLFPTSLVPTSAESSTKLIPINRAANAEQMSAVQEILKRKGLPPYLIYGPPGTGKTVTIIEAILQVIRAYPKARILACAPSNLASDLLLERLIASVEKRDMLRLNAYTRPLDSVPSHIIPFCSIENDFFCTPDRISLKKYRVVVTTNSSAAMLDAEEVQPGHFTHIFLDEAGQGTEPEIMVSIGNLAKTNTVVVLAGDHRQLGPVIRSPIGLKYGLDKSYLERLSSLTAYLPSSGNGQSLVYNNSMATKLVRNYRSHPAILDLPSRLFYDGELVSCAGESRNSLLDWDELPNKKFPVLFIGMEGRDEREGTSPSWFNAQEASKVVDIVKKIMKYRRSRVSQKDIGVIAPYNRQVNKLKKAFASQNLGDVKVGSVESFQGQEKRVIIISTVRSSKEYVEFDKKHNLGFLTNSKRFNVAITRAKELLIIVGNPHVLSQDRCWNELLRYCTKNNSYIGCASPFEIMEESKQLHLAITNKWFDVEDTADNNGLLVSLKAAVEDPQWPDGTC